VRILHFSDLHGHLPKFKADNLDLIVVSGDICPDFSPVSSRKSRIEQRFWFFQEFVPWLEDHGNVPFVGCWGNHDFVGEVFDDGHFPGILTNRKISLLNGTVIYGLPQQPIFYDWAFNEPSDKLRRRFEDIPDDVTILVTHGPPYSLCDSEDSERRKGSIEAFDVLLHKTNIRLVLCGHIHNGFGFSNFPKIDGRTTDTWVVNSSHMYSGHAEFRSVTHLIDFDQINGKVTSIIEAPIDS